MTTEIIVALITSVFASTGLWSMVSYSIQKRNEKKDGLTRLVLGLAHEQIIGLCLMYIRRGSISKDEYEDLIKYLYTPYRDCGGNGTVERLVEEVKKLPISEEGAAYG